MTRILYTFFLFLITSPTFASTWKQKTSVNAVGRHRATGIAIGNKGYVGLGHVNGTGVNIIYKDWWEFDPAINAWTQKADFPALTYAAIAFGNDKFGIVGGGVGLNSEFFKYNPQNNTWTAVTNCPGTPTDSQAFAIGDKGYVYQGLAFWEYDINTDVWTTKASPPINIGSWASSFAIGSSGYVKFSSNFYEYKPAQNTWVQRASFPGQMSNGGAGFSVHGKGYMVCGYVGSLANVTDEVWEYQPGNNTWSLSNEFKGTSRRFPVAFNIGDIGYFGLGTNGINFNDLWEYSYDPLSIDEFIKENEIYTYPNPVIHDLNVNIKGDIGDYEPKIQLYDFTGRKVYEATWTSNTHSIKMDDQLPGTYIIQVWLTKTHKWYESKLIKL